MHIEAINRRLARPLVLSAGLAFAGCAAVGPNYTPPATGLPPTWSRIDPISQPELRAEAPADLSRWWQSLDDPLLTALIDEAMQANHDLRGAKARLRQARAQRSVAAAGHYPGVTASGSASRNRSSEEAGSGSTSNYFNAGLDASWEVDVFGGVRRGIEAAGADLESSEASLAYTRVTLASEVALNYIEIRTLQIRLGIARDNLASQSETLQITEWRAQAGLTSIQDVEQARSNREQTRAEIPALETSLAGAEHGLDILLGKPPGTLHARLADAAGLPTIPAKIAVGIPAETLRQRPDVRAAERTLAAETARLGVAQAARYPSFNLSGSIGLEALKFGALGEGGTVASSLFASITSPIFDAGRLRAQVDVQDAVREQAQIAYEKAILTALQDVENSLVALARSQERAEALGNATESARVAAELARQRYSSGLIDFQSVLDTERTLLSNEDSLASTREYAVQALVGLYKALGGGWTPDGPSSAAITTTQDADMP